ncbi:hypothetical protein [Mesorhizobium sp.]|nr:hypothetical protein [Mesorhizobium sp.]
MIVGGSFMTGQPQWLYIGKADALQRPERADGERNQRQQIFDKSHRRNFLPKSIVNSAITAMTKRKEVTRSLSHLHA